MRQKRYRAFLDAFDPNASGEDRGRDCHVLWAGSAAHVQ
jgi:hypothetical protein